jgi:hypothetical protein
VAELKSTNAQLHAGLDAARSNLSEVKHHDRARASESEDLKKIEDMRAAYDAVVKEKAEVEEIERVKLQRF